jgi:prevent-host-death family protein
MTIGAIRSEEARNRFRDMLDTAIAGGETVIERHGKPTAVIVNYAQWQAWKRQRKERLARIRQQMDAGIYATQEELDAELKKRGLL